MRRPDLDLGMARRGTLRVAAVLAAALLAVPAARADIIGFSGGAGWTGNNNGTGGPTFGPTSLTLTDGAFNEARSAWFNAAQGTGSFVAQFTYTATFVPGGLNPADGIAFALQNAPAGVNALGFEGGGLGYAGISPSAAVQLNLFTGFGDPDGTNFYTNGQTAQFGGAPHLSDAPINLASGDPIRVTLTYDDVAHTLTEDLLDLNNSATHGRTYAGVNLPAILSGSAALVGFTGGTGAGASTQVVSDFTFTTSGAPVPEPGSLTLLALGAGGLLGYAWRRRKQTV
jgi:hypothetical protein